MDWGVGEYELTAAELWPVAERVVARAGVQPGERVLDLGCGTGNVALLAARAGAVVTGIDPAPRLLDIARERVSEEGLDASFVRGTAEELPFEDAAFDAAISVFALIFAADAERAVGELLRVVRPGGRAVMTAWTAEGPLATMMGKLGGGVAALSPEPPPKRFAWGDERTVREIFERRGAGVEVDVDALTAEASSAEAFIDRFLTTHPVGIPWRKALQDGGTLERVRADAIEALDHESDGSSALRLTSRYLVLDAARTR